MMNRKKEFGTEIAFTIMGYVYLFMVTNLSFILSNLVLVVFVFLLEPTIANILYYSLALILAGPSITALFCCIVKQIELDECNPFVDYFRFYRKNFVDTLKIWAPLCVLGTILVVNIQFYQFNIPILNAVVSLIYLLGLVTIVLGSIYVLLMNVKFKFRVRDFYRLSLYLIFTQIRITLGNLGILFITTFVMYQYTDFLIFFIASPLAYLLIKNSYPVLANIQDQFVQK